MNNATTENVEITFEYRSSDLYILSIDSSRKLYSKGYCGKNFVHTSFRLLIVDEHIFRLYFNNKFLKPVRVGHKYLRSYFVVKRTGIKILN